LFHSQVLCSLSFLLLAPHRGGCPLLIPKGSTMKASKASKAQEGHMQSVLGRQYDPIHIPNHVERETRSPPPRVTFRNFRECVAARIRPPVLPLMSPQTQMIRRKEWQSRRRAMFFTYLPILRIRRVDQFPIVVAYAIFDALPSRGFHSLVFFCVRIQPGRPINIP